MVFCPRCGRKRMSSHRVNQCQVCKNDGQRVPRRKCAYPPCPNLCEPDHEHCSKSCRLLNQPIPKEACLRGVRAARQIQHQQFVARVAKLIQEEMETAFTALPIHLTDAERKVVRTAFLSAGAKIYKRAKDTERVAAYTRYVTRPRAEPVSVKPYDL